MKKVLLSLAAVTAIAAAATPAAADHRDGRYDRGYGYGYQADAIRQLNERQAVLAQRLHRAIQRHEIDRQEAWMLTAELREFDRVERRYRRDGLSRSEIVVLDQRLDHLQRGLQRARRDDDRRHYGYGYGYGDRDRW